MVPLQAGSNAIRLVSAITNGPNVDYLYVTPPEGLWNEWLDLAGLNGNDRSSSQDPDSDGPSNLWEYLSGGNPKVPDLTGPGGESRAPRMALVEDGGGSLAKFTFLRRADYLNRGLVLSAESSTTLAPPQWTGRTVTLSGSPEPVGDGTVERVKVRVDRALGGQPRIFFRLRADLAGD